MAVRDDFSAGGVATTETSGVVVVVTKDQAGGLIKRDVARAPCA